MKNSNQCCVCGGALLARSENPHHPFCSARCKLVDLSKWMGGNYSIPGEPVRRDDSWGSEEEL